jgi:hypothetical protein
MDSLSRQMDPLGLKPRLPDPVWNPIQPQIDRQLVPPLGSHDILRRINPTEIEVERLGTGLSTIYGKLPESIDYCPLSFMERMERDRQIRNESIYNLTKKPYGL